MEYSATLPFKSTLRIDVWLVVLWVLTLCTATGLDRNTEFTNSYMLGRTESYHKAIHSKSLRPHSRQYEWGPWGAASTCTRSCGVGVRYRKRYCYKSSEKVTYRTSIALCSGQDRQYELCNSQPCDSMNDFMDDDQLVRQCAAYDRHPYRGKHHRWKPYSMESNPVDSFHPCSLVCVTAGHPYTIAVKFSNSVLDGTHCSQDAMQGVCIAAKCVPIGCDRILHSEAAFDACGVCGGDNSTCTVVSSKLAKNISLGYTDIISIPANARSITITELGKSSAVFALRNDHGIYFVNSRLSASYPTIYNNVGGTTFHYHHPLYSPSGRERMEAQGPTNETLYVMMLAPEPIVEVSVSYYYTVPKVDNDVGFIGSQNVKITTIGPKFLPDVRYEENLVQAEEYWSPRLTNTIEKRRHIPTIPNKHRSTSDINRTEKGDQKYRNKSSSKIWGTTSAMEGSYYWKVDQEHCTDICQPVGLQQKPVHCYSSYDERVDDDHCEHLIRPTPDIITCPRADKPCPPRWEASTWSKCSVSCGSGNQFRGVRCWRVLALGFDSTVHDFLCEGQDKPPTVRQCREVECGPMWETAHWGECSSHCGRGIQTREARCHGGQNQCDPKLKPVTERVCHAAAPCQNEWVLGEWGKCSAACGEGVTHRRVICGEVRKSRFHMIPDNRCRKDTKPAIEAPCKETPCDAKWYTTDWSQCSKSCGDGSIRVRKVNCYNQNRPSLSCDYAKKPATSERCRLPSCDDPSDPACQDDVKTNCALVLEVNLCRHWYYRKACCHACRRYNSTEKVLL